MPGAKGPEVLAQCSFGSPRAVWATFWCPGGFRDGGGGVRESGGLVTGAISFPLPR